MQNKIVVVGADHHNTLGVVESFGLKDLKSYVVLYTSRKEGYVLHSKWVEDGWCCSDEQELIDCLSAHFTDKENKSVLIATNDIVASIIDKHAKILNDFFFLQTTWPTGTLLGWMGKEKMSKTAREVGMNVPKTWIITDNEIPSDIEYPIITKAISSVAGSKSNIRICKTKSDLRVFLKEEHCSTIQVQRFIEKDFEFQFIGCSINKGENVLIPGRTHINRSNGLDNTFFLSFDKCEKAMAPLVQKAVEFVKQTKYTGTFSMEFLRDKNDGKDYFTEMNFRNDGNAFCATWGG
jgi:D-aspartate ligase